MIATATIGVKLGGWGINLEKANNKIKTKGNKFSAKNNFFIR